MTELVGYLLLFLFIGVFFVFIHLVAGKFIRPIKPDPDKLTIYECGEPTIGSAWIQFDLRFYVIALLFVIFDVEVVFFFPWAVVFGKANTLAALGVPETAEARVKYSRTLTELSPPYQAGSAAELEGEISRLADQNGAALDSFSAPASLAWLAFWDILVFFGVLLVGFAYLWKRGDLDWVRSTMAERAAAEERAPSANGSAGELVGAGENRPS